MDQRARLQRDGYILLRQAIAPDLLDSLRSAFDAGVKPADQWPVPRGTDQRHSLLADNRHVQAVCRLPQVLAAVGVLIGEAITLATKGICDPFDDVQGVGNSFEMELFLESTDIPRYALGKPGKVDLLKGSWAFELPEHVAAFGQCSLVTRLLRWMHLAHQLKPTSPTRKPHTNQRYFGMQAGVVRKPRHPLNTCVAG